MGKKQYKMSQSLTKQYIHLVFSTKKRIDMISKQHLAEVHSYVAGILNKINCYAVCVGGTSNHIHVLYVQSKTMTLSDTVRIVKTNSSKWINETLYPFEWQNGYGAFSVSRGHVELVVKYIKNQEAHHRQTTFQDEFRRICEKNDAQYDERYVWD